MASPERLMAAGIPAGAAVQIGTDSAYSLTAAGSTKATALALTAENNIFATVATATGLGCQLPTAEASPPVSIYNGGAATLAVYAYGSVEKINALSAGAAYSIAAGKSAIFMPCRQSATGLGWIANLSA